MIEQVSAALVKARFPHDPRALELHSREDRVAVRISHDRMAWFPSNEEGRALLTKDRRILRLLERYCRFPAPRVLYEDESAWDLRALVNGAVHPLGLPERVAGDSAFAHAFGEDLGLMLAVSDILNFVCGRAIMWSYRLSDLASAATGARSLHIL